MLQSREEIEEIKNEQLMTSLIREQHMDKSFDDINLISPVQHLKSPLEELLNIDASGGS